MDLKEIFSIVKEYIPIYVLISVVLCIILVYYTIQLVIAIENYLEEKNSRQYKFFDHKKIWLNVIWSAIITLGLAFAAYIKWNEFILTLLEISGGSTILYEAVLKKLGLKNENERNNT